MTAAESTSQIDWRLELIQVPVSDIDRAKAFYVEKAGFVAEHDHQVSEQLLSRGVEVGDVQDFPWGRFVFFTDPDGNGWAVQGIG